MRSRRQPGCGARRTGVAALTVLLAVVVARAQPPLLSAPVNDFANVIDAESAAAIDRMSRALQRASGDVVVVATTATVEPYADIEEYANTLFENQGRGVGDRQRDNGVLIVLAIEERRARIEVGYGLEEWITDGFAGQVIRRDMAPELRNGRYGAGLLAGTARIVGRIAAARGVTLEDVPVQPEPGPSRAAPVPLVVFVLILVAVLLASRIGGGPRRGVRRWGTSSWSGWSSGVGPFGGGWRGSRGGFGGGFGGFGGGRSGGGGASGGW